MLPKKKRPGRGFQDTPTPRSCEHRKLSLCILKVSYTLHFKRMPVVARWFPSSAFPPGLPFTPPHLPTHTQALSSASISGAWPAFLWSAEESSEAFWHQLPVLAPHAQLWPHALATQTFFALTLNFPAAKDLLPNRAHCYLILLPKSTQSTPSPCSSG